MPVDAASPSEATSPARARPNPVVAYLDHAASTPVDAAAAARMLGAAQEAANPSSIHGAGVRATREIERARGRIADRLGATPEELIFTSGATEANNFAIKGVVLARLGATPHLLVSAVEHPSVTEPASWCAAAGLARLTMLPVDADGIVRPEVLAAALRPDTALVSVQQANNETGVLQPLAELAEVCRRAGVLLHVDASQGFGKVPLDVRAIGIDLLTASGHKLHGPKGVGLLYLREGIELLPLLHGGGHERGLRGGTLNTPAIAGFGEAVLRYLADDTNRIEGLRARFEEGLRARFPGVRIHGAGAPRVATITNFALPGAAGKAVFLELDRRGILVSTSSACHATKLTPSPVLKAMGATDDEANGAVRASFGRTTTTDEIDLLLHALTEIHAGVSACR